MGRWRRAVRELVLAGIAVFALAACSTGGVQPTPSTGPAETPGQRVGTAADLADRVTEQDLVERLRHLEELTLAADGTRGPGSAGFVAAADWIEKQLRATGFYQVRREPFTIHLPHPGESTLTTGDGRWINQRPLGFSPGTPAEGVTGRLVVATGTGCSADAWDGSLAGQIGLVDRGECSFTQKVEVAAAAGAVALVIANHADGGMYATLDTGGQLIPTTGITRSEGARLRSEAAAGEVSLSFTFDQRIERFETFNLIAETTGGDATNVVMAGAHLDSVPEGPGTNDNGSGSVILLETALELAQGEQPTNKVRFAWWSGEEWGLLGSIHWVNQQIANDPQVLTDLACYVNIDMVASPNYVIGVYDGDGSSFGEENLSPGSDALEHLFTGWFDAIDQPWVDIEMGGASDHAAFVPSGVPVGGLFTGAGGSKTPEEQQAFGGRAAQAYDENYHEPTDTFDRLSTTALAINGRAAAYVVAHLAFDTSPVNGAGGRGNQGTPTEPEGFGYAGTS